MDLSTQTQTTLPCYNADSERETCECCQKRAADPNSVVIMSKTTAGIAIVEMEPDRPDPVVFDGRWEQPETNSIILDDSSVSSENVACESSTEKDVLVRDESEVTTPDEVEEWDLCLPKVELDDGDEPFNHDEGITESFSLERLIWGVQHGMDNQQLVHYLSYYDTYTIRQDIDEEVEGYPPIFYIVSGNDVEMLRTWISHGGDPNSVEAAHGFPLLAFAILISTPIGKDTTAIVTMLLALGARASVIPKAFYSPYQQDLPAEGLKSAQLQDLKDEDKNWCKSYLVPRITTALNLSQRYFLEKASRSSQHSQRQKQIAAEYNSTALLGISYLLIGQTWAARAVINKLLNYMVLSSSRPLVLTFAGPSGHGKTELARRLGNLLSLDFESVDMTEMKHENDLFGPKPPFVGAAEGSPLNNFLVRMSGKQSIVFLDEFEKTTTEVQNSLLIPLDEGRYQDRRDRTPVDCTKTIWILATNALDPIITDYCSSHESILGYSEDNPAHKNMIDNLQRRMKQGLKTKFGAPLSGRISAVLPFLPFSLGEQAVVAHKFFLELAENVSQPVSLTHQQPGKIRNLLGNVQLDLGRDWSTCSSLVKEGYDVDLGARSIRNLVREQLEEPVVQRYLEENRAISEDQAREQYVLTLHKSVVRVAKAGVNKS